MPLLIVGGAALTFGTPAFADANVSKGVGATITATQQKPGQVQTQTLLGQDVVNASNEDIGEIDSIILDRDGNVAAVIVGVGGFLGIGDREVAIDWGDVELRDGGDTVVANFTRAEIEAMPEYDYADENYRGTAFRDDTYARAYPDATPGYRNATGYGVSDRLPREWSWRTVGARGDVRVDSLIGTDVVNQTGETIGEIDDVVISGDGEVQAIVGAGGFLGMGEHHVALPWHELTVRKREGTSMMRVSVAMSEDQLRNLPKYERDRQQQAETPADDDRQEERTDYQNE